MKIDEDSLEDYVSIELNLEKMC